MFMQLYIKMADNVVTRKLVASNLVRFEAGRNRPATQKSFIWDFFEYNHAVDPDYAYCRVLKDRNLPAGPCCNAKIKHTASAHAPAAPAAEYGDEEEKKAGAKNNAWS
jgi:hypothetical protein